ncbi:MAG TPA: hypothetical protein VG711_05880, partial [Phycisphaerales bacterium]|nr:hypothetical protein [Phycisphaerales bacterium]
MHFSIKPSHPALQATSALISTDISLPLPINPDGSVTITHLDPLSRAKSVKLRHWLLGKRTPPSFTQVDDVRWELRFTLPPVHRFEYQLEITLGDDSTHTVIDPLNPFSF